MLMLVVPYRCRSSATVWSYLCYFRISVASRLGLFIAFCSLPVFPPTHKPRVCALASLPTPVRPRRPGIRQNLRALRVHPGPQPEAGPAERYPADAAAVPHVDPAGVHLRATADRVSRSSSPLLFSSCRAKSWKAALTYLAARLIGCPNPHCYVRSSSHDKGRAGFGQTWSW